MEIWHNPHCSKSRATLELIEQAGVEPTVRRYLDDPPTAGELAHVLDRLGIDPWDLTRLTEDRAKELGMAGWPRDDANRQRWIETLADNPRLIERPVVLADDGRAVIGRPPENARTLLDA